MQQSLTREELIRQQYEVGKFIYEEFPEVYAATIDAMNGDDDIEHGSEVRRSRSYDIER